MAKKSSLDIHSRPLEISGKDQFQFGSIQAAESYFFHGVLKFYHDALQCFLMNELARIILNALSIF